MAILKGVKDQITVKLTAEFDQDPPAKPLKVQFEATYAKLSKSERKALAEDVESGNKTDDDVIRSTLLGLKLKGQDGEELEYCYELVEELLEVQEYYDALSLGYIQAQLGSKRVRGKN